MTRVRTSPRTQVRGSAHRIYHIWFSPRRRKAVLQGDLATAVTRLLAAIAAQRGITLLECEPSYDHVHLLIALPANVSLPESMRYLKGASARYLFQQFPELKLDIGHDHFWQRGYGSGLMAPGGLGAVRRYIREHRANQEPRSSLRGDLYLNPR